MDHQFFLIFYVKLDSHEVREVIEFSFLKKVLVHYGDPKGPRNEVFGGLDKNLTHSCVLFLFEYESTTGLLTFCKTFFLELWFIKL